MSRLLPGWHNYLRNNMHKFNNVPVTNNVNYNRITREITNKIKNPDISTHETFYHVLSQMSQLDRNTIKSELTKINIDADRLFK